MISEKIKALIKALNDVGVYTKFNEYVEWIDEYGEIYYGMEIETDIAGNDWEYITLLFTPQGENINSITDAPKKK